MAILRKATLSPIWYDERGACEAWIADAERRFQPRQQKKSLRIARILCQVELQKAAARDQNLCTS